MNSNTGPLYVYVSHCQLAVKAEHLNSKNSPPPSAFDLPGKAFDIISRDAGCTLGPEAFKCLQDVPFEVRNADIFSSSFLSDSVGEHCRPL